MLTDEQPYDRKHMTEVLDSILVLWNKNQHLRLGQLLINVLDFKPEFPVSVNRVFYITDTQLVKALQKYEDKDTCTT